MSEIMEKLEKISNKLDELQDKLDSCYDLCGQSVDTLITIDAEYSQAIHSLIEPETAVLILRTADLH